MYKYKKGIDIIYTSEKENECSSKQNFVGTPFPYAINANINLTSCEIFNEGPRKFHFLLTN